MDMAGKKPSICPKDTAGAIVLRRNRVVVLVVFLINFHTWGMNSVSRIRVNRLWAIQC